MDVTFLISTMNKRLMNVTLEDGIRYVIVHQITDGNEAHYLEFARSNYSENIVYEQMFDTGLSKSRNKAIELCQSKFGFVLDDDVKIDRKELECFLLESNNIVSDHGEGIYFSCSHILGNKKKLVAKQSKFLNIFTCAKIASIDMCLNVEHMKENKIKFDEKFGLGTNLPSGEEYILLTDVIHSGGKIYYCNNYVCVHPLIVSGNDFFSNEDKIRAKREMFNRLKSRCRYIFKFLFYIKKLPILIRNSKLIDFTKTYWNIKV
ncbi:TPA: hypothetical protein NJ548_002969 [Vibrio parahaemolyticus]|nr:hypothetical protein [Vibrio parahaemolyticus]